ncbi:MAG: hypothetical protein IJW64_04175 [Clostridia bacterium]|nr:hypothetical protein [Clostridia bacterium]
MEVFKNSKWIWVDENPQTDCYGEFFTRFNYENGKVICNLSCDSDYVLFINGKFVSSNQYGDFEWYKIYDSIDVTDYLKKGENTLAVLVWYFGVDSQRYKIGKAGLIFELLNGEKILSRSDEKVLSRYSKAYQNGREKFVTTQLGFSFAYDATREDDWVISGKDCAESVVVKKECELFPRPIKKQVLLPKADIKILKAENNYYLVDLGEETVGLPTVKFISQENQSVRVDWGEDLFDGHVRRIIGERDFSFDYFAKSGLNEYTNYAFRISCRYLEIYSEKPIELKYLGVIPQVYQVEEKPFKLNDELDQKIYDLCVNTLKKCMMEHYVDTPWREQCLYSYDSRNQILCGFYAFENGNKDYAKANLKLIGMDRRDDGLLAICYPCGNDLTIPSFSLYYVLAIKEYLDHTDDKELIIDLYPKILSIITTFINNSSGGLACKFEDVNNWNFYDWTEYMEGRIFQKDDKKPDSVINFLFIIALKCLKEIDEKIGKEFNYEDTLNECVEKVKTFFVKERGLFEVNKGKGEFTVLANALAILAGVPSKEESEFICNEIASGNILDCTLSMKILKYQALLLSDEKKWANWILGEIRREYSVMVESGSSCVWETIDGAKAFGNAGSLCHGWSAVPVYVYHVLKKYLA